MGFFTGKFFSEATFSWSRYSNFRSPFRTILETIGLYQRLFWNLISYELGPMYYRIYYCRNTNAYWDISEDNFGGKFKIGVSASWKCCFWKKIACTRSQPKESTSSILGGFKCTFWPRASAAVLGIWKLFLLSQ